MKFLIKIATFLTLLNPQARAETPTEIHVPPGTTATFECVGCEVIVQNPRQVTTVDYFDWSLRFGTAYLSANEGPASTSLEGLFDIDLRMADWVWFSLQGGPGVDYDGEAAHATLTELIAVDWRIGDWFEIITGVRHRVAFGRDGGSLNAVGGELGIGFHFGGFHLGIAGMFGEAWFPTVRTERTPDWEKSEVQIETIQETGSGFTWCASLDLGWRF